MFESRQIDESNSEECHKFINFPLTTSPTNCIVLYRTFDGFLKFLNVVSAFDGVRATLAEVSVVLRSGQPQLFCNI